MKKGVVVFSVLLVCLALTYSYNVYAAAEPYKVGCLVPLTGYSSWVGVLAKEGAELQVDLINKAGGVNGRPLQLILYDTQSKPEEAIRAAQRLLTRDGVIAMTGSDSVPIMAPVFALANQKKIPAVLSGGYPVDPKKEPYSFNVSHPSEFAVAVPFHYFKKKNMTKIAFLMPIGSLGELGTKLGHKVAGELGIRILGEEKFEPTSPDITPQLAKLKALDPAVMFSFSTGEHAAMVVKSMAQLNMTMPVQLSHGNATKGFLKMVSNLPAFIVLPSGKISVVDELSDADPMKKPLQNFNKQYIERYKEPCSYYAGQAADFISVLAEGLKLAGTSDPVKVRDSIERVKGLIGNNGIFNMSPDDHYGLKMEDMVSITIKDGKWALLK